MTTLDNLVQELCPEGVQYKTLGELGKLYGGLTGKSKADFKNGNAKFITYKNVYSNPALNVYPEETVIIAQGEKQRALQYGDIVFTGSSETPDECGFSAVVTKAPEEALYLNSFCFFLRLNDGNTLLPDFAKHLFRSSRLRYQIGKTASGVTRFNVSKEKMAKIRIPLPPLPVQREIVRILDNFTELTEELTEELTAELTARRKQYEYYREKLLSADMGARDIAWRTLGEIADIKTGRKPEVILEEGSFEYINAGTSNSGYTNIFSFPGDTVTTPSRGQGGIGFVGYQKNPFWLGPLCYGIRTKDSGVICNRFLYHFLCCNTEKITQKKNEGGTPALNLADLQTIQIPLFSRANQQRIISILDRFDAFCNDLTSGLPAEIADRKKQYEYYRDKLLTFPERRS